MFLNLSLFLHTSYIYVCFQPVAFIREHMCRKVLLIGYTMRLELTLVCSLNAFQLVWAGFIYRLFPFFLECVYFSLLYPSLFDMFIVVCVCVCVCALARFCVSLTVIFLLYVFVWVCVLGGGCVIMNFGCTIKFIHFHWH